MQPASEALAQQYQLEQAARGAAVQAWLALQFQQIVTPENFGASIGRFVEVAVPRILRERGASAAQARPFLIAIQRIEKPSIRDWRPPALDVLTRDAEGAARASLRAVGAAGLVEHLKREIAKEQPDVDYSGLEALTEVSEATWAAARDSYAEQVGWAGARHGLNGGRETIANSVRNDTLATGWARVTSDDCCFFCALLATRNFVFEKESFERSNAKFSGEGSQKVHDNCACQLVPTFGPRNEKKFTQKQESDWEMYQSLSPGGDQLAKFRRVYEGRPQEGDLAA